MSLDWKHIHISNTATVYAGCSCSEVTEHQESDIWHITGFETKTVIYKHFISWLLLVTMPCYFPSKALWELLTERVTDHFTLKLKGKKQMQEIQHVKTIMFVRYFISGAFNALLLILITIFHWFAPWWKAFSVVCFSFGCLLRVLV